MLSFIILVGVILFIGKSEVKASETGSDNQKIYQQLVDEVKSEVIPVDSDEPASITILKDIENGTFAKSPIIGVGSYKITRSGKTVTMNATGECLNCTFNTVNYKISTGVSAVTGSVYPASKFLKVTRSWSYLLLGTYTVVFSGQAYTSAGPGTILSGNKTVFIPSGS